MWCAGWLQVALVVLVCIHASFAAHSTSLGRLKDRVSEDPPAWAFGLPNAYGFTVNPSSAWANKDIPRIEDFRAVLSDLDGTLADTDRLHTEAYNQVLVPKVTDRNMTEEEYAKVSFADDARVFSLFAKHRKIQLSDEQVKQLVVEKQKLTVDRAANSRLLYPGAKDLLHHISSRVPLALVTMSDRATALAVLKPYTIESLFTTVVATEDVSKGKPDPMAYQIALAKINEAMKQKDPNFKTISPSEVLVLEDTARGVESGKSFGATVIAFEQTTPKKKLLARGADMTIPTVKALDDTLFRPASPSSSSSSSPSTAVTPSSSSSSSTAVTPSPLVSPALASPASSTLSSGSSSSSGCSKPPTTTIQPLTAAQDNWVVAHSRKRPQAC